MTTEVKTVLYPNLRAEMARRNITMSMLAEHLGVRVNTISDKINGVVASGFTFKEAKAIKDYIGADVSLEYLFEEC